MTRKLRLLGLPLAVVSAIVLSLWAAGEDVDAGTNVIFAIGVDANGDTTDDCSTAPAAGTDVCNLTSIGFDVKLYLLDRAGQAYEGYDAVINFSGVSAQGTVVTAPWPDCDIPASFFDADTAAFGCIVLPPPLGAGTSTYTGLLATVDFTCSDSGTVTLVHGPNTGKTRIVAGGMTYRDFQDSESLTINCPPFGLGDVNSDGDITSIDALLVLQHNAGLINSFPNGKPDAAGDLDDDGDVDSIDALIILQIVAGLVDPP